MPPLSSTFGAMFITFFIDASLFGVAMLSVLQYFYASFKDPWPIKVTVGLLGLVTTVHITFFCGMVYKHLIIDFGNFLVLDRIPWEGFVQVTSIYVVAFVSQSFFISRIWILSKRKLWFTVPILLMSVFQFGAGLADTAISAGAPAFSQFSKTNTSRVIFCLISAACDISITAELWYLLHETRSGIPSTDSIIDILSVQAISRGAVTSLAALSYLIIYFARPNDMYFMIAFLPMCQHHVIAVMASLNSRRGIRQIIARDRERSRGISVPFATTSIPKNVERREGHILVALQPEADP